MKLLSTHRSGSPQGKTCLLVFAGIVSIALWASATDWFVLCNSRTGEIELKPARETGGMGILAGPFPGARTAGIWVREHHPDGQCIPGSEKPTPAPAIKGRWIAVCRRSSGDVDVIQGKPREGCGVLWVGGAVIGSYTDRTSAVSAISRLCPSWRCDPSGMCNLDAPRRAPPQPSTWEAGALVSVVVPVAPSAQSGVGAVPEVPGELLGPGTTDLSPLIGTATAAAEHCAYPAALAAADHMLDFDPRHPWLVANLENIRRLAVRQETTERATWQASAALRAGELEKARDLAEHAADTAVSCQTRAASALLQGIDTAITQEREARSLARRRAAAALLPRLINLAGLISGAQGGSLNIDKGTVSEVVGSLMPAGFDPCAFQIEYRDSESMTPSCTCPDYSFDLTGFRCVR